MKNCEDCKNCTIYSDESESMRHPFASCDRGHYIVSPSPCEFTPKEDCGTDYEAGDPTWI